MDPAFPQFFIRSKRVVLPDGVRPAAIVVENGVVQDVVNMDSIPSGKHVEDAGDLLVMSALVDTHVHINEPGRTDWEGFDTGTRAAAAGGITTLVDMPLNSSPVTTSVHALGRKLDAAQGKLWVDCGCHAGLVPENAGDIEPLIEAGVLGVKAFLIDSGIDEFPPVGEHELRAAMPVIARSELPLLVHAEKSGGTAGNATKGSRSYTDYLRSRPPEWEHEAINLMISLCREYGTRTHIVHLSASSAVPLLEKARNEGLPITVETCPHYLFFEAEEVPDGDTRFKCAPPIRESENRERLWQALSGGVIDCIVSDHSPCPPHMKLPDVGDFMKAWGGIPSLQLGLSVVWTEARKRGHSVSDMAAWMCARPAGLVSLGKKGRIERGFDADLVVWNPEASFIVEPQMILHRHAITPYEGRTLFGKVITTYLRGHKVFDRGKILGAPSGTMLLHTQFASREGP